MNRARARGYRMLATHVAAIVATALLATGAAGAGTKRRDPGNARNAWSAGVVGLAVTYQEWDQDRPWAKTNPRTRRATGTVVEGGLILTTAQMVADATFIGVEKLGRSTRQEPRIVHVDPEIDLALLAIDEASFFDDVEVLRLATETPTTGQLQTVRWNEQQLESAASRVLRFEVQEGFFGRMQHAFLLVQTDLQGGGWAEPVVAGDRLVGLTASQTELRARVIPAEIIGAFLTRAKADGAYRGFPVFGARYQVNEDPALAAFLGQQGAPRGVIVRQIPWGSSACGVLEPRDILLSVDGHEIDAGGYYAHPRLGRLLFPHALVEGHAVGDVVPVRVLRSGEMLDLQMTLRDYPAGLALMPERRMEGPPPYAVIGGLLFRELDGDYLRSWGPQWAERAPLRLQVPYLLRREEQTPDRRRIILLASVLPTPGNVGYQDLRDLPVASVNGRRIDSIPALIEAFAHPEGEFEVIELEPNGERQVVVLDAATLEAETRAALETYGVPEAVRLPASVPPDGGPECPGQY